MLLSADDFDLEMLLRELGATSFCVRVNVSAAGPDGTQCFECCKPAEGWHHVVPKSRGGTKQIPLCGDCHKKAHHSNANMEHRTLTRAGLRRAKARGVKLGSAREGAWTGKEHLRGFKKATERSAAVRRRRADVQYAHVAALVRDLRRQGLTLADVAQRLNADGHCTGGGRAFTKAAVWRLCKRHAPECLGHIKSSGLCQHPVVG